MILADSDVLIDFLHGQGASAQVARELERAALGTSVVSRFELLSGARTERQKRAVTDLLAALPLFTFEEKAADLAAAARLDLDRRGQRIAMADCMIAGIALANGLRLMTRNRRHFERVTGLELVDTR